MAPSSPIPPAQASEPDWTEQVTDFIVDQVDRVRLKTTGPVVDRAPLAVFGVMALLIVLFIVPLSFAILTRLAAAALGSYLWAYYAGLGAIFMGLGFLVWTKRKPL